MIQDLERALRSCWERLGTGPAPPRFHFLKLASEAHPAASVPFLLFAFAPGGRAPLAVAKVARASEGDAAVAAEAAFLTALHARLPAAVAAPVPRLLHCGHTNGRAFALMSAVPGEVEMHNTWSGARARHAAPRITAALDWAWSLAQSTASPVVTCGGWIGEAALREFQSGVEAQAWEPERRDNLERRLRAAWNDRWPTGVAHGDFFPGNVLFHGHRLGGVVDWALGAEAVPCFFDTLTYETSFAVQAAHRPRGGLEPELLRAVHGLPPFRTAQRRLQALGIDTRLGSTARAATLVMLHRAARRHGRESVCRAMACILAATLES